MVYTGDDLKVNNLKIGLNCSNVCLAHKNYLTTNGYAITQSSTGQKYLNSGTTKIMAVKGMDITGTTNVCSFHHHNHDANKMNSILIIVAKLKMRFF